MHIERLRHLASSLRTLSPSEFNIHDWVTDFDTKKQCGTVCCAAGWLPRFFPLDWEWGPGHTYTPRLKQISDGVGVVNIDLETFFGISTNQVDFLFMPSSYHYLPPGVEVTPSDVARHIDKLIAGEW